MVTWCFVKDGYYRNEIKYYLDLLNMISWLDSGCGIVLGISSSVEYLEFLEERD